MIATSDATTIMRSREGRAQFTRTEAAAVRRPRLLQGLLATADIGGPR